MVPRFWGSERLFTITIIVAFSPFWNCFSHFNYFQFNGFFQFDSPLLYICSMLSEECQWRLCRAPKNRKSESPLSHSFLDFMPRVEIKKKIHYRKKSFKNAFKSILKYFYFLPQFSDFSEALITTSPYFSDCCFVVYYLNFDLCFLI